MVLPSADGLLRLVELSGEADMTSQQLLAGQVPPPPEARGFLNTVARAQTIATR